VPGVIFAARADASKQESESVAIKIQRPRARHLVEAATMGTLIVVAYFSVTTINALPRGDDSLTQGASVRSRLIPHPDAASGPPAPSSTARVTADAILTGHVPACAPKDPACDIRLADVEMADARPESVRAMLASLASNRCATPEFRSFAGKGYGQFHRLHSSDDRYLGVIFVDAATCARSPLLPGDAAIWPAPAVVAAHSSGPLAAADGKAARPGTATRVPPPPLAGDGVADPGALPRLRPNWDEPQPSRCISKPVMTDVELARCRTS
jgi:hypothetical protein